MSNLVKSNRPPVRPPLWLLVVSIAVFSRIAIGFAQAQSDAEKLLTVRAGTLPIILSAPHGGRLPIPNVPLRRGVGVAQFATERDSNTDELAQKIAIRLDHKLGARPYLIIALFDRKYLDANRARALAYESREARPFYDAYHRAVLEGCEAVRKRWGRGLLLDIHGQGSEPDAIFRGTDNGRSVTALERQHSRGALNGEKSIFGQLASKGYKIIPPVGSREPERRYTGGYTTQTYGSYRDTGIDAIQLELGTRLRSRANLQRTADDLADAIIVFAREYLLLGALAPSVSSTAPR
jgi:N-formylglutamate amidohydrolase